MDRRRYLSLFGSAVSGLGGAWLLTGSDNEDPDWRWSRVTEFTPVLSHGFERLEWNSRGLLRVEVTERAQWDGFALVSPQGEVVLTNKRPTEGHTNMQPLRYPHQLQGGTYELRALEGDVENRSAAAGGITRRQLRRFNEVGRVKFPMKPVIMDANVSIKTTGGIQINLWCGGSSSLSLRAVEVNGRRIEIDDYLPVSPGKWQAWQPEESPFERTATPDGLPCYVIPPQYTVKFVTQPATELYSVTYPRSLPSALKDDTGLQVCKPEGDS